MLAGKKYMSPVNLAGTFDIFGEEKLDKIYFSKNKSPAGILRGYRLKRIF